MIDTKKIIEAAERNLQGTDMYVVGCTCTPGNDIELLIDSDTSVAIAPASGSAARSRRNWIATRRISR
mgnify:CR=1 FL=1